METVELLDGVKELIERWGWVQHSTESADGLDVVSAFEVTAGVPLRGTTPEQDAVISVFADDELDNALAIAAEVVGGDPQDGELPNERWAWVHVLTCFNDDPSTTVHSVQRVLVMASEVATSRGSAGVESPRTPGYRHDAQGQGTVSEPEMSDTTRPVIAGLRTSGVATSWLAPTELAR